MFSHVCTLYIIQSIICKPQRFLFCLRCMYSHCAVCVHQRFLFCLLPYLFSEWHIVPQLCVQIKQSRVYSRKALAECKASRRLGKQIRGLSRFLSKAHPAAVFPRKFILCHKTQKRMLKTLHLAHPPLPILIL